MDRLLERKQTELAAVVTEHSGERAPEPRVRKGIVREAVRADHRVLKPQDALQVLFVHLEVDSPGRTQTLDCLFHAAAPLGTNVFEIATLELRVPCRPGHDDAIGSGDPVREQHRRARDVGIDVQVDALLRARMRDGGERLPAHSPARPAVALVVRDDHGDACPPADLEGFVHRIQDPRPFVAHVCGVDTAVCAEPVRERHDLVGGGFECRRVGESGAQADAAGLERLVEQRLHARNFGPGCRAIDVVHDRRPQRGVAHERRKIERRRRSFDLGHVLAHRRESVPLVVPQKVHRGRGLGARERGEADPAVPGHHRRHALADLRRHVGAGEHRPVIVRVRVDESRRDDQSGGVNLAGGFDVRIEVIADRDDAVAGDRDVEVDTGSARAVDDIAGVNQQIARGRNGRHSVVLQDGPLFAPNLHGSATFESTRLRSGAARPRRDAEQCLQFICHTVRSRCHDRFEVGGWRSRRAILSDCTSSRWPAAKEAVVAARHPLPKASESW